MGAREDCREAPRSRRSRRSWIRATTTREDDDDQPGAPPIHVICRAPGYDHTGPMLDLGGAARPLCDVSAKRSGWSLMLFG